MKTPKKKLATKNSGKLNDLTAKKNPKAGMGGGSGTGKLTSVTPL